VHDAEPIDVAFEDLGPLFADMAAQARSAGMADAVPVDGLLRWRGAVYAVGLTAMTRQEPSAEALQPHPRPILAFLTRIDRPFLGDLAQRMQISEFIVKERIDPNCNAWLPLVAANGETVGGIGWIAPQPGASLYEWVIVPVLLAFAALGLLVTLLIRRTLRIAAALESLASVSHELRSPLHAIIGFASFLKDQKLGQLGDPRYVDYARQIHEGGQSLHQIVDDLIDYTRLDSTCAEAGGQADAVPVDFAYILEVVARGLTPRAEEKGVALDWSAPAAMAKLRGDERGLRQLLRHLIDNAIKFTPSGGSVQATLEQVPRPGAGTMVRLEVRDSGLGMEPVMIDQMLAPFTQADADIDRRHGGLGIGLALVRVLLRKHEATLEIDSAPMEGTRFVVTFPPQRTVTDEPRPIDGLGESA
jgi:signal transduction histidine kinase